MSNENNVWERKIDLLVGSAFYGGVESVIQRTVPFLRERGFAIRIIQMIWRGVAWAPSEAQFHCICMDEKEIGYDLFLNGYKDYLQKNGSPDLMIAVSWPLLCQMARQTVIDLALSCPIASWLHSTLGADPLSSLEKEINELRYADFHLAVNRSLTEVLLKYIPDAEVYQVRNPLDERVPETDTEDTGSCEHSLVYIGRFSEEKNLPLLLQAIAALKPRWKLKLIGSGMEEELQTWCEGLDIRECVEIHRWCDDPWKEAKGAFALVISSDQETGPLVMMEALSRGLPVISTPVGEVLELIQPGKNGFVYPKGDPAELAKLLLMLEKGILQRPDPKECMASVRFYRNQIPLRDFAGKIESRLSGIGMAEVVALGNPCRFFMDEWGEGKQIAVHSLVVICKDIDACIDRVRTKLQNLLNTDEIVFVDNASTDSTIRLLSEMISSMSASALLVGLEHELDPLAAKTIGLAYASGLNIEYSYYEGERAYQDETADETIHAFQNLDL